MNVQFAVQDGVVFVLEVNPRASHYRTVPYPKPPAYRSPSRRTRDGRHFAKRARRRKEVIPDFYAVKEAVFPFIKFPGVDTILGPEMRSTGEVMGVGASFSEALRPKAQLGAGERLSTTGKVFLAVRDEDKPLIVKTRNKTSKHSATVSAPLAVPPNTERTRHHRAKRSTKCRKAAHTSWTQLKRRNRTGGQHRRQHSTICYRQPQYPPHLPHPTRTAIHHHRRRRSHDEGAKSRERGRVQRTGNCMAV